MPTKDRFTVPIAGIEDRMAEVKSKRKETMSRAEAAARLSEVANALGASGEFELERGGEKLKLEVPDEVTLEFEVEIEDDETELEVEIKWSRPSSSASPSPSSASQAVGSYRGAAVVVDHAGREHHVTATLQSDGATGWDGELAGPAPGYDMLGQTCRMRLPTGTEAEFKIQHFDGARETGPITIVGSGPPPFS